MFKCSKTPYFALE